MNVINFPPRRGGLIFVFAHSEDGGCWAVGHEFAGGGAVLSTHFKLDDALAAARLAADRLGARLAHGERAEAW